MSLSPSRSTDAAAATVALDLPALQLQVRTHIYDTLRQELVGPSPGLPCVQSGAGEGSLRGEEILRPEDAPLIRYGAGILFPQRTSTETQERAVSDPNVADVGEGDPSPEADPIAAVEGVGRTRRMGEADTEQEVNRANEYLPSAMGITALLRVPPVLEICVSAGSYRREEIAGRGWTSRDGEYRPYKAWWRTPHDTKIALTEEDLLSSDHAVRVVEIPTGNGTPLLAVHVYSRIVVGVTNGPRERMVTATLLNGSQGGDQRPKDEDCFFQCGLRLEAKGGEPCFLEYPEPPIESSEDEQASLRLLYRRRKVYAVGHGVAPEWDLAPGGVNAQAIWTDVLPACESPPVVPRELAGLSLSMRELSRSTERALELCAGLADEYEKWIVTEERRLASDVSDDLLEVGQRHLMLCRECLTRMRSGINLIKSRPGVALAFRLMNRAMLLQQAHYRLASQETRGWTIKQGVLALDRPYVPPNELDPSSKWRPFQLAFVLLSLQGIVEPASEDREIVDVIWFPTGGGKTEAYLGLTAFTLFHRRLVNPSDGGTAVLMRYTLRLLTSQQFQRAASLICACEVMRREGQYPLGETEFSAGLWVGSGVTPNREEQAVEELQRLLREGTDNPFVILNCPWCGAGMGPVAAGNGYKCPGYRQLANPRRVRFVCGDPACEFRTGQGLPLRVIDEQLYDMPPDLVIGTVDKFALLPWEPRAGAFFGTGANGGGTPPELVIQDELHLIAGPLGSMVGHYETVIEALCRRADGRPAKLVASTATIARAIEQVAALYARPKTVLFPPQGLEVGSSFFAEENVVAPGRLYVGVFASGLPSQQTAMVRTLASLLQSVQTAATSDAAAIDPYWTLVGYFNSIRELGYAATLVSADIREYLSVLHERLGLGPALSAEGRDRRRYLSGRGSLELTSRVSGAAIGDALQALFTRCGQKPEQAVDVCLATNMIQVGLDVPRLGLMVVTGQPKTTSEYIQATSRVGRGVPGLVVTVLSPAKPRDRSHYEHFRAYHASIYRHVEPTSVTPFAVPVRERALHALVIALCRLWGGQALEQTPVNPPPQSLIERVTRCIMDRVKIVDPDEGRPTSDALERLFADWKHLPASRYGKFGPPDQTTPMMYPAGSEPLPIWQMRATATPSSMRSVDAECEARTLTLYPER